MEVAKRMNCTRLVFQRIYVCKKYMSTKTKVVADLDQEVIKNIENNVFKPRKHPGRCKVPCSQFPKDIVESFQKIIKDLPVKNLVEEAKVLHKYLYSRHPPLDDLDLAEKRSKIAQEVRSKYNFDPASLTEDQKEHFRKVIGNQVTTILHQRIYNWKKLEFTDYSCLVYFFARAAENYAAVHRIFKEISIRDPNFKPKTLFDFGSGFGTVSWAAENFWKDSLKEFFCVDPSVAMNDLASLILRKGNPETKLPSGVFQRQFLPSQHRPYNLVVSAYSLFELPSSKSRLETLLNLWQKTEDYLVVVEQGTRAGFRLVLEARDFILTIKDTEGKPTGHVFAPCPNDVDCPRFVNSQIPCNFKLSYFNIPIGQRQNARSETFSYVVLKKGPRSTDDLQWPRIVQPVLKKSKHAICRMCTSSGTLEEVIFTAIKSGKTPYRCARSSEWGDLLPVTLKTVEKETTPKLE